MSEERDKHTNIETLFKAKTNTFFNTNLDMLKADNTKPKFVSDDITPGNVIVPNTHALGQKHWNGQVLQFDTTPDSFTPAPGDLAYNINDDTLNFYTVNGQVIQIGQELAPLAVNKTGAQIDDGTVVYISGADVGTDRPKIVKADASTWEDSQMTLGLATIDIADDAIGPVTIAGYVRGLNTAGMTVGDRLYLSPTAGEFTTTRPVSPDYIIDLGVVVKVDASEGIIAVNVQNNDDYGFWNKSFIEAFDLTVAEDTGSIIASLERAGGGNLTMRFSTGPFTTLVTPPMTKTLTAGTATVPVINYLYILESDQTQITLSTSSYPAEAVEHIKIAKVIVLTAAITALDDPLSNQNSNDHALEHQNHVNEWIRAQRATYESPGIDGNSSTGDDYFEIETVPDKVYFRSTAGTIRQMHLQNYPVKDTGSIDGGGSDIMYVVNDPDAAYTRITDLIAGITKISDGTLWGNNKHIGLVFFGVISKTGEGQQLMCLLPSGQYNNQLGAENDINGYTNVSIPDIFRGTAFLICKIVAKKVGSTIEYESTLDLRGFIPGILTGAGGGAAIVSFPDNTFEIFDEADPTKLIEFQVSGVATGNKRIITAPDKDLTLIDTADAVQAVEDAGLDLATTKVITSQDEDLDFTFGRVAIGSPATDLAYFAHRDQFTTTSYALRQDANGTTLLNTKSGTTGLIKVNNATVMDWNNTTHNINLNTVLGFTLKIAGNIGFFNTAPQAQSSAYTPTNVTTDRSFDANATSLDEIADVLGTLINDLQTYGLIG